MIFNVTGGGGTSLNFKVVGGTSQPTGREGVIWVNTDADITSWVFAPTAPETPAEGMVWFSIGTSSTVAFNALRKNTITVCPLAASQYIGGAWVSKKAVTYRGGQWVEWFAYLYNSGDESDGLTGGWQARGWRLRSGYTAKAPTLTKNEDYMAAVVNTSNTSGVVEIMNDIDLTPYSTVYLEYSGSGLNSTYYGMLCVADREATYYSDDALAKVNVVYDDGKTSHAVAQLDVSGINQAVDIFVGLHITSAASGKNTLNIHKVWLQ